MLAFVAVGSVLSMGSESWAWNWGRFHTASSVQPAPAVAEPPRLSAYAPPAPHSECSYTPSYQTYAFPGYSMRYPGYYEIYNRGTGGLYGPPYRSSYLPGTYFANPYRRN